MHDMPCVNAAWMVVVGEACSQPVPAGVRLFTYHKRYVQHLGGLLGCFMLAWAMLC